MALDNQKLIRELSKLIEAITYYRRKILNNNSVNNLRKGQYFAYSLNDLVYVFSSLHKACLIRIIKTFGEGISSLKSEELSHKVKESVGVHSTNNYIKRQGYSIRIAQLNGYYITEVILRRSIKLDLISRYKIPLNDEVVRDCIIGFRASDEFLLHDREAVEMKTTRIWQAALWVALHSPANFSIWATKGILKVNKIFHIAFTIRTKNSKFIMRNLTKTEALKSLGNKPIRWLCYLLGDGSVSGRKIEFSVNREYHKDILSALVNLGYNPKYVESKRSVVLTGKGMRMFAQWILTAARVTGLSGILDKLNICKWENIKEYAVVARKEAPKVETPCGILRERKDRSILYLTGNLETVTKVATCLENMGIRTRIYKIKGTYMLELSKKSSSSLLRQLEKTGRKKLKRR